MAAGAGRGRRLDQISAGTPYAAYAYSYPHKTAYAALEPARPLAEVWAGEDKSALFLYLHVPFCEMRCGFCNLFTTANPRAELAERYVAAIEREAERCSRALGDVGIARMAVGGGTPTYLSAGQLDRVMRVPGKHFGTPVSSVPVSVETSPRTADGDRLGVLRDRGVSRVSMGVQSFIEGEVSASGRAQKNRWVEEAVGRIRSLGFPVLNLDLIYGLPGQTVETFLASVRAALAWRPEELYLYPLYVRPLTGLARWGKQAEDAVRLDCYRSGRDLLLAEGYEQVSMRMFRLRNPQAQPGNPVYCCQEDGMVGLGCGARSYTRALHYSNEYAVGSTGVKELISAYVERDDAAFDLVTYGCELGAEEQRRRWVIKSLLRMEGLGLAEYRGRFGADVFVDLPELQELVEEGWAKVDGSRVLPTAAGLERSDAIGPWLYSNAVKARMDAYELR